MYEARQNKDKVNHKMDRNIARRNVANSNVNCKSPLSNIVQAQRNTEKEIVPQEIVCTKFPNRNWEICTSSKIVVGPHIKPKFGSRTSGDAPWKGYLFDNGYLLKSRTATRLHVINSNFGGSGSNYGKNLHPGSQLLNKNHLTQAENKMKEKLNDPKFDSNTLTYTCSFCNFAPKVGIVEDPDICYTITVDNNAPEIFNVNKGNGMYLEDQHFLSTFDSTNDSDSDD